MTCELPFQLVIKQTYPERRTERLLCTELLRVVPGRRCVYNARWNDRGVIVKAFSHKLSSKRHLRREWQSLMTVARRGLRVPELLFYGQCENGDWAVVVEKIENSSTALEMFENLQNPNEKLDLLILVGNELAGQHNKGVLQKDLHLGNFLLKDDEVFLLDAGQMQFFPGAIDRKKSLAQLARLVLYLSTDDIGATLKICEEYFKARGWHFKDTDTALLKKQISIQQQRGIRHGLKKCLRTSRRTLRIKTGGTTAVFDKDFCNGAEPIDFIEQIDTLMDKGEILKNGNTCYVSRLAWNNKDVVVKRYNHKGFIHSLRHTIRQSRARRCWLHGNRLEMLKISSPKPLAYIEQYKGLLIWKSYLVTEYIHGQKLYNFLQDERVDSERRLSVMQQVKVLLERLGKHRITHGDLKHTNIIITNNAPFLTDLDAMQVHRWNWSYRIKRAKDLERIKLEFAHSTK